MKNYLSQNLNFAKPGAEMSFFRKIQNFIKSERAKGFFPSSIPNVLNNDLFINNYLARLKFAAARVFTDIFQKIKNFLKSQFTHEFPQKLY